MIGINKDPVSAYTHIAGLAAGIVGLVLLVVFSAGETAKTVGMALYAGSLVALFAASSSYHFFDLGDGGNRWLKRVDHGAIFLFIAGSYMNPLIHTLDGAWRISMIAVIGGVAVAGVCFKLLWVGCPRWLSAGLYLVMGWLVVIPAYRILPQLSVPALCWLVIGGLTYSAGAVVYASKRPDPYPGTFGFHEVWHLFVLVGAAAHFAFNWTFVDYPVPPFGG